MPQKIAIVTGGRKGIGRACAEKAAYGWLPCDRHRAECGCAHGRYWH